MRRYHQKNDFYPRLDKCHQWSITNIPRFLNRFCSFGVIFFFVLEGNRYGPFVFESLKSPPKCYRITNPQRHGIIGTFTRFYYLQCMHLMWILIVFPIPFDLHIELREKNLFSFQSSRVRHWTEPTTLRKGSVTPVLCWVNELGLQEWNKGCHPSSRVRHWTEPTTLRKISVTLLLSWSIELNLQHLELKNVPKNSEVGWQESGISPTFHGNRVTPKNIYLSL